MDKPAWIKQKQYAPDFETIKVPIWDAYKDFVMDKGCYVLIKVLSDTREIAVAVCDYNHQILKEFRGHTAQDLYVYIFDYDKKNNKGWFTRTEHCAYLGKELKKAEIAFVVGYEYVQE